MSTHFLRLVCSPFAQSLHFSNALAHVSWAGAQHFVSVHLNHHPLELECVYVYGSYVLSFLRGHANHYYPVSTVESTIHISYSSQDPVRRVRPSRIAALRPFRSEVGQYAI